MCGGGVCDTVLHQPQPPSLQLFLKWSVPFFISIPGHMLLTLGTEGHHSGDPLHDGNAVNEAQVPGCSCYTVRVWQDHCSPPIWAPFNDWPDVSHVVHYLITVWPLASAGLVA